MSIVVPINENVDHQIMDYIFCNKDKISDGKYLEMMNYIKDCHNKNMDARITLMSYFKQNKNQLPQDFYEDVIKMLYIPIIQMTISSSDSRMAEISDYLLLKLYGVLIIIFTWPFVLIIVFFAFIIENIREIICFAVVAAIGFEAGRLITHHYS